MKLSEAIRLGAMLHPQCFGKMRRYRRRVEVVGTCALAAAQDAGYKLRTTSDVVIIEAEAGWSCPACWAPQHALLSVVVHLNDNHRWTRERIADWVATVEPAETTDGSEILPPTNAVREVTDSPRLTLREETVVTS